ncbi:MAG: replicative DNA helicase [Pirellulales bacterium]|nr:replicative DNA helicase [Pirellulales bacterium]
MANLGRVEAGHTRPAVSSEILDRLPPQSLDAEKSVLGSLLLDSGMCDDVVLLLRPDDFYSTVNQKLYRHLVAMHDEGSRIDTTLLVERLKQAGDYEAVGGAAYLAEVLQSVAVAAHAVYYAKIVRDKATLRSIIHASTEILRDAYDPMLEPREMIGRAEEKIFAIHDARSSDQLASMHDVLVEAFAHIDKRMEKGTATGLPTGFTDLDNMTGGLHESELVILAARPSMGKTALATNIADYVTVESQACALLVSLEMSRLELAQRMLCSRGEINGKKFRGNYLSGEDRDKLVEASSKLSKAPLFIDDTPSRTVTEIAAAARRLKRRQDLGLIVIDYLQLIEPDNPKDPRQEQVAKIARRLKGLARELKVPLLCLAQLNRQAEATKDNRPRLSHLRESGAIEQDADVVMFVHREEYYHTREEAKEQNIAGQAEIIVAKQRNGPTGEVKLHWFQDFTKFKNATQKAYDEFEQFGDSNF